MKTLTQHDISASPYLRVTSIGLTAASRPIPCAVLGDPSASDAPSVLFIAGTSACDRASPAALNRFVSEYCSAASSSDGGCSSRGRSSRICGISMSCLASRRVIHVIPMLSPDLYEPDARDTRDLQLSFGELSFGERTEPECAAVLDYIKQNRISLTFLFRENGIASSPRGASPAVSRLIKRLLRRPIGDEPDPHAVPGTISSRANAYDIPIPTVGSDDLRAYAAIRELLFTGALLG